jgi:predicted Zn-dependent protease
MKRKGRKENQARKLREWRHWLKTKVTTPLAWFWYDLRLTIAERFGKLGSRFATWWKGRRVRYFFQGIPALLVTLGVLGLLLAALFDSRVELIRSYQTRATQSMQDRNFLAARVAYERLTLLGEARPEDRYRLAVALFAAGDRERANALIASLAPLGEGTGLASAHLWLAERLLDRSTNPTRPSIDLAERHLLRALQLRPDLSESHVRLAGLYLQTNRGAQAEKHLIAGFDARPEFGLVLVALYSSQGQSQQARSWAERAAGRFGASLSSDPNNAAARKNLAEARLLLGEYPQAISVLQDGLARTGDADFRTRIAKTCTVWLDAISGDGEKEQAQRLALMEMGLKYEPTNIDLLVRLARLARPEGPSADKPRELLQAMLARGQASLSLHMVLGMDAFERGKLDQARQYLDQAYRLDPSAPALANNLAWVLAHSDPPELDRALNIMNTLIERQPQDPRFRETRGQILARKGKWTEAITDLQAALPSQVNDRALHKTLAEAYRRTGNEEMATQHQKLADLPPVAPARTSPPPKSPLSPPGAIQP